MTLDDLDALLDFHYWARDRVLDAAAKLTPDQFEQDLGGSFKSVRETLVHIYWADWAWYQMWHGAFPAEALETDQFTDVESIRRAWSELESKARAFVTTQIGADAHRVLEYRRLDGSVGAFPFAHMVQHLVNHGSYHRGQLTMLLRQLGVEPPESMDLIMYYRGRSTATARRA
jgi:uncharacterized damage-inducible protein DinB